MMGRLPYTGKLSCTSSLTICGKSVKDALLTWEKRNRMASLFSWQAGSTWSKRLAEDSPASQNCSWNKSTFCVCFNRVNQYVVLTLNPGVSAWEVGIGSPHRLATVADFPTPVLPTTQILYLTSCALMDGGSRGRSSSPKTRRFWNGKDGMREEEEG